MPFQGFTLDFHTPWINGMAKKMILLGLRALINPATRNLVINHHGKVFELKAIAPIIAGADLIFLIVSPTEYAIWTIKSKGSNLVPVKFQIEDYALEFGLDASSAKHPSTAKSNSGYNQHKYLVQTKYIQWINFPKYGIKFDSPTWGWYISGMRNSFLPTGFDVDDPEYWDSAIPWINYEFGADSSIPFIICSGRNNWQVLSGGVVIKDLELWKHSNSVARIEYRDKDEISYTNTTIAFVEGGGSPDTITDSDSELDVFSPGDIIVVSGSVSNNGRYVIDSVSAGIITLKDTDDLAIEGAGASVTIRSKWKFGKELDWTTGDGYNYYAVLSKDKIIGEDRDSYQNAQLQSLDTEFLIGSEANICTQTGMDVFWGTSEGVTGYSFKFGDVFLEYSGYHLITTRPYPTQVPMPCEAACTIRSYWTSPIHIIERNNTAPTMIDYDNIEIDETFVCFYYLNGSFTDYDYVVAFGFRNMSSKVVSGDRFNGTAREFFIAYRRNGGSLVKIKITQLTQGDTEVYGGTLTASGPCGEFDGFTPDNSSVTDFRGQKIVRVSCKVTEEYMLYTYILLDYTGPPGETHFSDEDDTNFTFNKRILGIIDIETGKRTEHEVDDDLLGDLYKDTFDEEKASAVGLHIT